MTHHNIPTALIAAPKSNSGKTMVTLGLIKALKNRSLRVQPFKCGPDYIDTMHHSNIAHRTSVNLDIWMSSEKHIKELFASKVKYCDVAIVEGVMGLFDGAIKDYGSAAHVARTLSTPVILVFDASAMAYSASPLLYGLKNFDRSVTIGGVIFNKVSGPSQQTFLKDAARDAGINVLGYLPKDSRLVLPSRHLGLLMPGEANPDEAVNLMAQLIEQHVNIDEILSWRCNCDVNINNNNILDQKLKIAIAKDDAFCFFYQANLDRLAEIGEVSFFSPLNDTAIPRCDLMWIPGGYPELHLEKLAANSPMISAIKQHCQSEKAVIAECGGMMYLGRTITDIDGNNHAMAGVFDYATSIKDKKLHLGYREITTEYGVFKGHEFHHSSMVASDSNDAAHKVKNARKEELSMPIFRKGNVWSSYLHLYLGERDKMEQFLNHLNLKQ